MDWMEGWMGTTCSVQCGMGTAQHSRTHTGYSPDGAGACGRHGQGAAEDMEADQQHQQQARTEVQNLARQGRQGGNCTRNDNASRGGAGLASIHRQKDALRLLLLLLLRRAQSSSVCAGCKRAMRGCDCVHGRLHALRGTNSSG